jgi:3-deoxy-D-manno-octulosonic-acid transferase
VRILLDIGYLLATPLVVLGLAILSFFTRRRYRAGFLQRLGGVPRRSGDRPCLWLHAVSVGELLAALPLVEGLRRSFPDWDLWVSTSTDTAQDLAARSLPREVTVFYYPLDYGWAVRRTLRRVRPSTVILLELELWPNFLLAAGEANIPVLVANGRISGRSYPRYRRLRALSRFLFFARVTAFAAQSEEYACRFESLGVPRERIDVLGNLKYDAAPAADAENSTFEKLGWADHSSPVLMGGSTHPGEENVLLSIWSGLRQAVPGLKLILAPRHIERAGEVEGLLASSAGQPMVRWSAVRGSPAPPPRESAPVVLVDVVGDLDRFYRLADVVFVGGSLVPRGGHNMLEPARLGKPVLFGPWISNFEEIARHLLTARAAVQVEDRPGLETQIARLLSDPQARQELGERAREAAGELGGATARHLEWILEWIQRCLPPGGAVGILPSPPPPRGR